MKLTKSGKPSHAKNPNARKKKPIPFHENIGTTRQYSHIRYEYARILEAQTIDDVQRSYEALIE